MTLLRAAASADAAAVAEVLMASRRVLMPFAPSVHSDDDVRGWVANVLLPTGGVTVAEHVGRIVGVLAVADRQGVRWIEQLMVHPDEVATGIGSALLTHAMARLAPPLRLYTFQANRRARDFYEHRGFVAVAFTDGQGNEERCPDVLYEFARV